jgi:hypothetical protein
MTLKKYKCTVSFQKCANSPDFQTEVDAISQRLARNGALLLARKCGYTGAVKNVTVKEITQ